MSKKLIVVLGPTASGKTAFSLELAKWITACHPERSRRATHRVSWFDSAHHDTLQVEIINADSRQLYKYMDIGTAKIRRDEMCGIPHHLLSVLDPSEEVNIAWYKERVTKIVDEVHARGNIPVLTGGSMLYISSIIDGLEPNPDRRSGSPPSTAKSPCPYDLWIIGMDIPRIELHRRINERSKFLLESGWIEEVQTLLAMGYSVGDPGFKACGYREIANAIRPFETPSPLCHGAACHPEEEATKWLTSRRTTRLLLCHGSRRFAPHHDTKDGAPQGDTSILCEKISAKTRQYARRQLTWWRYDKRIQWVNPETADFQSLVASLQDVSVSVPRRDSVHPPAL